MGIQKSIQRRLTLVRGESIWEGLRIVFASKAERRKIEARKFPGLKLRAPAKQRQEWLSLSRGVQAETDLLSTHLDYQWYASNHNLSLPTETLEHFVGSGMQNCYAPRPELAGADGRKLSHWGAEYMLRLGFRIGEVATETLMADDCAAIDPVSIKNQERKHLAVVTAIFGEHDRLLPIDPQWRIKSDFFLISDRKFSTAEDWRQVHASYYAIDPRRRARFFKTHLATFFSEYDHVLWIDGNVFLSEDPWLLLQDPSLKNADFATFRHGSRQSLLAEAAACVTLGKDDPASIARHLKMASTHAVFCEPMLLETMVLMLRPSSDSVRAASARWWHYIMNGSKRDQLSLALAMFDSKLENWAYLPGEEIEASRYFLRVPHAQI